MTLIQGAENLNAQELLPFQQAAWKLQSQYVHEASAFYRKLWNTATVPENLQNLSDLPLSDKAQLHHKTVSFVQFIILLRR